MATINIERIISQIEQIAMTHSIELPQSFYKIKARANDPILYVGLIGEFSSGKSTLVNAWLGNNLLKTDILQATTAAPTLIRDDSGYRISTLMNNGDTVESETIREQEKFQTNLLDYLGKVSAQEEYSYDIRLVSLSYPNEVLQKGRFAIIDTPGANAENERHKKISGWAVEELCDVAIVIIPANIPYSSSLDDFIRTYLDKNLKKCVFIMTKVDSVRRESELESLVSTVKMRIETSLGIEVPEIVTFAPRLYLDALNGAEEIADRKQHFISEFEENTKKLFKLLYEKRDEYFFSTLSEMLKSLNSELETILVKKKKEYQEHHELIVANTLPDLDSWLAVNAKECKEKIQMLYSQAKTEIEKALQTKKDELVLSIKRGIEYCENSKELTEYMKQDNLEMIFQGNASSISKNVGKIMQNIETEALGEFGEKFSKVYRNLASIQLSENKKYGSNGNAGKMLSVDISQKMSHAFEKANSFKEAGTAAATIIGGAAGLVLFGGLPIGAVIGAAVGNVIMDLLVPLNKQKNKYCNKLLNEIDTKYFPAIQDFSQKQIAQILELIDKRIDETTLNYKKTYQELIEEINQADENEKAMLQAYSRQADKDISELTSATERISSSDKIEILSNEKFSYIEQLSDIIPKSSLPSRSSLEIQKLLGSSAKLTRYVDILLQRAVAQNDTQAVEDAVRQGANPNLRDENQDPVLISAIRNNNIDLVKTLIECKANPDTQAANSDTALITAIKNGSLEIMKFLVKQRANVNAVNANMETPLITAVIAENPKAVEFLLAHDADLKAKDKKGWTAKKWAVKHNQTESLAIIKEYSKSYNAVFFIIAIILIIAGAAAFYFLKMR
ncbi:dynamin family protein [bacterium]|nr:dynamin family protein [bacterium]